MIAEATGNTQKTWKLANWTKNWHTLYTLTTPFLKRLNGTMALTQEDQAQSLIEFFFPPLATANLSNIPLDIKYPTPIPISKITDQEILQAVAYTSSDKAPKNDRGLNSVLKLAIPTAIPALKWIYNRGIQLGYCL